MGGQETACPKTGKRLLGSMGREVLTVLPRSPLAHAGAPGVWDPCSSLQCGLLCTAVSVQCFLQQSNSFILVKTRSAEVAQITSSPRNHCWAQLCSRLLFRGHQLPLGVRIRAEIPLSSFSCSVLCHQPLLLPMVDIWHQDVPGTFPHCSAGIQQVEAGIPQEPCWGCGAGEKEHPKVPSREKTAPAEEKPLVKVGIWECLCPGGDLAAEPHQGWTVLCSRPRSAQD